MIVFKSTDNDLILPADYILPIVPSSGTTSAD